MHRRVLERKVGGTRICSGTPYVHSDPEVSAERGMRMNTPAGRGREHETGRGKRREETDEREKTRPCSGAELRLGPTKRSEKQVPSAATLRKRRARRSGEKKRARLIIVAFRFSKKRINRLCHSEWESLSSILLLRHRRKVLHRKEFGCPSVKQQVEGGG